MSTQAYLDAYALVEKQLGYTTFWGGPKANSDLTPDELQKVGDAVASYIVNNPSQFDPAQVTAAQNRVGSSVFGAPLLDNSFTANAEDFASNVGDNALAAGDAIAGVGKGVLSTFKLSAYLIPIAAVIVAVILLYSFYKKRTS